MAYDPYDPYVFGIYCIYIIHMIHMIHSNNDYRHMIHMYLVSTLIVVLESPMARNHRAPRLVSLLLPLPPVVRGWHGVGMLGWHGRKLKTQKILSTYYIIITFSALKTYPKPTAFRYIQHYLSMLDHLEVKWAYRESANWMLKKTPCGGHFCRSLWHTCTKPCWETPASTVAGQIEWDNLG